ncbi:MAG: formylglycine-generating enzyme family protein [Magnetococcales bacterium]|nr:formylglycine-generating enzyme family protein [Magnetococcales bacterium]
MQLRDEPYRTSCELLRAPRLQVRSDCERLSLRRITRPDWAVAMGRDRFGLWADFEVAQVRQRLRWIPPGRFWMGSPEEEPGRLDWENQRHEVTIKKGYWLFDTPCTQALWQAVMGENPSRFRSPKRPVEQVSWDDVKKFLKKINQKITGLDLVLPSESQWEYACRAGTTTAIYSGDIRILGEHNAPALDPIAWYGGNSGIDFDLKDGLDSSSWKEKQYPHRKAGTRPVALKAPNPWGLYDMLGNVWEWCADDWHDNYEGAPLDGSPWLDAERAGGDRVIRGGSWFIDARLVRAASRVGSPPGVRDDDLGFRCARVPS